MDDILGGAPGLRTRDGRKTHDISERVQSLLQSFVEMYESEKLHRE